MQNKNNNQKRQAKQTNKKHCFEKRTWNFSFGFLLHKTSKGTVE